MTFLAKQMFLQPLPADAATSKQICHIRRVTEVVAHVCIHECRFAADDELFVASLEPVRPLRLLDLAVVLPEGEGVTEFESLDVAIHMLFMTGEHLYDISSAIVFLPLSPVLRAWLVLMA
jgi:hypothetical protein